jgi:thiamine-phosphate pyrophosphorylase
MTIKGLYAVTDPGLIDDAELLDQVAAAIEGGAAIVQYRHKHALPDLALAQASNLARLCRAQDRLFIVNDDPRLAHESGAHGVHIGRDDIDLESTRAIVRTDRLIGVSCYNELELARAAQQAGADYVAFGSFYPSNIKPDAVRADLDLLRSARRELHLPIVAIGGINADNGAALLEAGADALAVIHAVFGQHDVAAAARAFSTLFDS